MNSIRVVLLFIILLLFQVIGNAQVTIKGNVKDSLNKSAIYANVLLKNDTGEIIAFTQTNNEGAYSLSANIMGNYQLLFTSMLFEKKALKVQVNKANQLLLIDALLSPQSIELNEVIIKNSPPIIEKKDTTIFDVKSFAQGNESVMEDLLKKIPGIQVTDNGTVKVGEKEVEKIMVDGTDFFDRGYTILTKNMPVNPVDKIELYKKYSNNKHLKGIEESSKIALNLILKDDFKRKWFGNIEVGNNFSTSNRYDWRNNLMNFGKKNKIYVVSNVNNIGNDAVGDINHLIRSVHSDDPTNIGDEQAANTLIQMGTDLPDMKMTRVNFNNDKMISFSDVYSVTKKITINSLLFFNTDEKKYFKNSLENFNYGGTDFTNSTNYLGVNNKNTSFGKIDVKYDISNNQTLNYTFKLNNSTGRFNNEMNFNNDLLYERLSNEGQLQDHKISYTKKLKDSKAIVFTGRYMLENAPQSYSINKFLLTDLFKATANNTIQESNNSMQFIAADMHLLDRKQNGNLLELVMGNQFRSDKLNSMYQLKKEDSVLYAPIGHKNNFTFSTNDFYLLGKYQVNLSQVKLLSQVDFHQIVNHFENSITDISVTPFYVNPKLSIDWKINESSSLNAAYSINRTNASVVDVYDNNIQTGFRSFSKGTGKFNQLNSSNVYLNYFYSNNRNMISTFLMYTKKQDFFSTNSFIQPNYTIAEKQLFKNNTMFSWISTIDRYFKSIKVNWKLTFGGTSTTFKNIVNNSELREFNNLSINYGFQFRSVFKKSFNFHVGTEWKNNFVTAEQKNKYSSNMSFLDLLFKVNKKINIQVQNERYYFSNIGTTNNDYYFMDVEASFTLKANKLQLFLSGNNLLNNETFKNYLISDVAVTKTAYKLVPRYVMLKVSVKL